MHGHLLYLDVSLFIQMKHGQKLVIVIGTEPSFLFVEHVVGSICLQQILRLSVANIVLIELQCLLFLLFIFVDINKTLGRFCQIRIVNTGFNINEFYFFNLFFIDLFW